ncbi:hypothetical protein Tco_0711726 [Tanacetum coccineum]
MVVHNQEEIGKGSAIPTDPHHTPTFIQPFPQPQKTQKPRRPKEKGTQIPQSSGPTEHVADEAVYKELDDSLVRAATTASSLEAEQDNGCCPKRQETTGDTIAQTRFENVSKLSNDPLLVRGNTLRSGEDSLKLKELMELCTNLQIRVLDLEKIKITLAKKIVSLKRRVKKLERKKRLRTHWLKRLYKFGLTARVESSGDKESLGEDASKQGRINAIDANEDITLVNDQDDADIFAVNTLTELAALKSAKPKVKANVVEEPSVPFSVVSITVSAATTTTTVTIRTLRKGIVITELEEPVKPKKKDLIRLDEKIASKLQAEFDEEERLAREKDEANLAQRLQAQEQEELTNEEKERLFVQFLEKRRNFFAAKRTEEKRNKPPTKAQQRNIMVNTFVDYMTELVEESSKKVETDKKVDDVQETTKVDDDQETSKIKELMEIVSDEEEVAIDAIPLAVKPPSIIDWKIYK